MTIRFDDELVRLLSAGSPDIEVLVSRLGDGERVVPGTGTRLGRDAELCPVIRSADLPELYLG